MSGDLAGALNSAFDEAMASSEPKTTESPEPAEKVEAPAEAPEEASPETKPEEPAKEEESGDVLFDRLTPDQIAKLKATPEGRALHRALMQSYTQKMQGLSEQEKLWNALNNPQTQRQAVEALARTVGLQIQPTDMPQREQAAKVADDISDEWSKVVGPEAAQLLRPLIEKTALAAVNGTLQPLQQATEYLQLDARARQAEAQVSEFRSLADKKGWKVTSEIETKMAALGQQYRPARPIETVDEGVKFMEGLYRLATADTAEAETEKRILERMNKAAHSAEPARGVPSVGRDKRSNITSEMSLNEALDVAMKEALTESGLR